MELHVWIHKKKKFFTFIQILLCMSIHFVHARTHSLVCARSWKLLQGSTERTCFTYQNNSRCVLFSIRFYADMCVHIQIRTITHVPICPDVHIQLVTISRLFLRQHAAASYTKYRKLCMSLYSRTVKEPRKHEHKKLQKIKTTRSQTNAYVRMKERW